MVVICMFSFSVKIINSFEVWDCYFVMFWYSSYVEKVQSIIARLSCVLLFLRYLRTSLKTFSASSWLKQIVPFPMIAWPRLTPWILVSLVLLWSVL